MAKTFERTLPVKLTLTELIDRGNALALQRETANELEVATKNAARDAKERLAVIDTEIDRLASIVREKAEPRPVVCKHIRDYDRGTVETVRLDTGEVVESRVMSDSERQVRIWPGEDQDAQPEAASAGATA